MRVEVSEAVARGHPDKIADQISDAILDRCLEQDPESRAAVETLISHDLIVVGGEISTQAIFDPKKIVKNVLTEIGYAALLDSISILCSINEQSPDISQSVGRSRTALAAGDQGICIGFATDATASSMPLSHELARSIVMEIEHNRPPFLGLDGKTQVSLFGPQYQEGSLVISWQHDDCTDQQTIQHYLSSVAECVSKHYGIHFSQLYINPSGRFVIGGPEADTGLTGRKQLVDSYGSSVRHGGGAFSGKDGTKVDRSGAYMARYVAKHIVAAKLCHKCEVQLVFAIGETEPLHIAIDCFDTQNHDLSQIEQAVLATFDFSVSGIIDQLHLREPIFFPTAFGGHFGRTDFPWERLDLLTVLQKNISGSR